MPPGGRLGGHCGAHGVIEPVAERLGGCGPAEHEHDDSVRHHRGDDARPRRGGPGHDDRGRGARRRYDLYGGGRAARRRPRQYCDSSGQRQIRGTAGNPDGGAAALRRLRLRGALGAGADLRRRRHLPDLGCEQALAADRAECPQHAELALPGDVLLLHRHGGGRLGLPAHHVCRR